jgi:hypothetical protein
MPALGTRRLAKLKPADLDAFYRQLLASGGTGGRPLAPGTVRRIHVILRRALNQGVKWGWLGVNPATATTPPRVPVSEIKPPSAEALGRVLRRAEAESPDLHCYLMLAAATGARRSELIALRWSDIDPVSAISCLELNRGRRCGRNGIAPDLAPLKPRKSTPPNKLLYRPVRHVFARLLAQDCAAGSDEALSAVDFGRLERSSLANGKPHP